MKYFGHGTWKYVPFEDQWGKVTFLTNNLYLITIYDDFNNRRKHVVCEGRRSSFRLCKIILKKIIDKRHDRIISSATDHLGNLARVQNELKEI